MREFVKEYNTRYGMRVNYDLLRNHDGLVGGEPKNLTLTLRNGEIKSVKAYHGNHYTIILTEDNEVYMGGYLHPIPKHIDYFDDKNIVNILIEEGCVYATSYDGNVFMWKESDFDPYYYQKRPYDFKPAMVEYESR